MTSRFRDTKLSKIGKVPNGPIIPQARNCQTYPVCAEYAPLRLKFHYASLYDQPFSRCKVVENPTYTEWFQNDLKHWTIKSTQYILHTNPPRPKIPSVSLYNHPFSRYKAVENQECTEWPQNDLKHLSVKKPCIHWMLIHEAQIPFRFAPRKSVFEIQWYTIKIGNALNDSRMTLIT